MNFIQRLFKKKEQQPIQYFRVYDTQLNRYFATGYNSTSEEELAKAFTTYINAATYNHITFKSWKDIKQHFQGVKLETSVLPFKDL